ncbi:histone deacetylase family protein [Vogesella sp. LIG4]|uniref:histone deacetylase family protein n=1 Tax=Vogesella sp. LIG4 TaxID=1192162 RepID=UPI00081F9589|nr:histone deacetylase family protein [Vogesella sp. LIG4]SCK13573.1 Acetoin utilization deacetylase AcuC [Vogesella sp. LIG4]
MLTIYSDDHHLHHGHAELIDGTLKPCFEMPRRADMVLDRVRKVGLGDIAAPREFGLEPVLRVHDAGYVQFLETAWRRWSADGRTHDALPLVWPVRGLRTDRKPQDIEGQLGYYSFDAGVPITAGTWQAIRSSANVALTALDEMQRSQRSTFALCRPPGHHAAADYMGGYCYFNNAAIAAQALRDQGAKRVAILDVDYHHGNGTQSIFYQRSDVMFLSLHGDPLVEYPYFLGHADEPGEGEGLGYNHNYPLPHGTDWAAYQLALQDACRCIADYAPDAIVVSLGVDTFEHDPISRFKLKNDDYLRMGELIGQLGKPTLFVMEGGYAVEDIGINAVNVLSGFESVAS